MISDDSDDEIVWSVSSGYLSQSDLSTESSLAPISDDDDYVVLYTSIHIPAGGIDRSFTPLTADLVSSLSSLSVSESDQAVGNQAVAKLGRKKRRQAAAAAAAATAANGSHSSRAPSPSPRVERPDSVATLTSRRSGKGGRRSRKRTSNSKTLDSPTGLGERPIVDDISECASVTEDDSTPSMYEEAVRYITSYVSPSDFNHVTHTTSRALAS